MLMWSQLSTLGDAHNVKSVNSLLEVNETMSQDKHVVNCFAQREMTTNLCNYMELLLLSVWPFLLLSHSFDLVLLDKKFFSKDLYCMCVQFIKQMSCANGNCFGL